jgi:hypothetical protein
VLGTRIPNRFVDLVILLPALFPATQIDTLEDWLGHFGLGFTARHQALADALKEMALVKGGPCTALVKASHVLVAVD